MLGRIRALQPDVIVTAAFVGSTWSDPATGAEGYRETWAAVTDLAPVVVVRDYPTTGGAYGPECLAKNPGNHRACSVPRPQALAPDLAFDTAADAGTSVTRVDLSDLYCDEDLCHPVVGGVPVYWDADHITGTFARSLAPVLAGRLELP
ncbi:hypothetical protein G7070_13335 [Propioniciclava coleopterorum]|uniref:SGNH domain-containing protein n=1 Tax=Propioniciclava coleopterorum TaxID=2714937 RepID=A0A6G7Y8C3_9ACTN|nr:hypothetical protein G7070_13335 [Propioniciclava coleopterorum]